MLFWSTFGRFDKRRCSVTSAFVLDGQKEDLRSDFSLILPRVFTATTAFIDDLWKLWIERLDINRI